MTGVAVNAGPMAWRLRIRSQSLLGNPDGLTDAIVLSSVTGTGQPLIAAEPSGDGAELDPLAGTTVTANYRVNVIDAGTSGQTLAGIIPGPSTAGGVITSQLGDTTGRSQLISRRAYLEQSFDGGATWPVMLCGGYVNRVRLISAATYEITVGETRRLEQTVPLFQTIMPGLDQGTCLMGGPIAWTQAPVTYPAAVITAPAWDSLVTYSPGDPVALTLAGAFVATASSTGVQPPNIAYWMPVVGSLATGATAWTSGPTFNQGSTVVGSDGATYLALQTNSGSDPTTAGSVDWLPLGATSSSAPKYNAVTVATPWNNSTSYVPGNVVNYQGITYVCISGNTNDPPPDVVHWTAIPAGAPVQGVWSPTVSYVAGVVVIGQDGNAYLSIASSLNHNPVQDIENVYWVPLAAIDFGTWGPIPDYGGMLCLVAGIGKNTQTVKLTPVQGWAKVPNPKAGSPAWSYIYNTIDPATGIGAFPSAYCALINSGVPALVQSYGPSPKGYGATYLEQLTGPRSGAAPFPIGLIDTFNPGNISATLGWVAGAICAQLRTQSGQAVTCNVYTQTLEQAGDSGRTWTQTPVVLAQAGPGGEDPGTFYVDWHDFYQVNAAGQAIAPVDRTGAAVAMPSVGSILYVKLVAVPITSDWPLHISMHPVDLLTTIWTTLQIPYDVANIQAVRSALGDDLILLVSVTGAMTASQVFEQWIGGPLGLGMRVSDGPVQTQFAGVVAGAYQLVILRQPPSALPTVAWTDADVYGEPGHEQPIYDLDEATTCQQVTYAYNSYVPWSSNSSQSRPGDDAVVITNTMTFDSEDYAVFGMTTESYTIPGGYGSLSLQQAQTMTQLGQQWSNLIFERFSRGATQTTVFILASSAQANLGDLVLWESNRMPNPALNQRGGVRLCQVVKKTFHPQGAEYVLEDLGAAEQPAEVPPTFTLAADSADPYHTVDITITNLGTLLTDYPNGSLQVQGIVQVPEPGSAQAGTVVCDQTLGMIGNATFPLPAVAMGSTVWYRANVRPGAGALPSIWTAWTSLTLGSPGSITGLTATPGAGGTCALTWTNPDADLTTPIAVWLRTGALASASGYNVLLSSASFELEAGDTLQLSATTYNGQGTPQTGSTYTWGTSNGSLATVSSSGLVTAVAAGSVTISATDTTAGRGSPVGESFGTIQAVAGAQRIVVTPSSFQLDTTSSPVALTAVVYDTNGDVLAVSVTWSSNNTGVATVVSSTGVVTPVANGQCTITASYGGVNGVSACTVTFVYPNLALAARASGKRFLLSMNQAYPNDNFAYVGGTLNTSLGLPNISTGYGTFTPGVADGNNWPELIDVNGVLAFGATATAATANNAGVASISTQIVIQQRVLVDGIRALAVSSGAGIFCIGATPTTDKKVEAYIQTGTSGTWQLTAAAYKTGSVRTSVATTAATALTALPPPGCWLNCIVAIDTTGTQTIKVYAYDDNGKLLGSGSTALSTALNTDGGANGCLFLNQAFNTNPGDGPTQAMTYGGMAVMGGTVQSAPAIWQPASPSTPNLEALYPMGDATSGTVSAIQHEYTGANFTVTGTVTGVYDNGGFYNWLIYPSQPGGEVTDENQWKEFHTVKTMTAANTMTFNYGFAPTVAKCRSLGIVSRGYLLDGSPGSAYSGYATYVTSAATAKQALQAYITGIVGYSVATWGTASQGGVRVWNIANEAYQGGVLQSSIWAQYLGAAWISYVATLVYAIDPTCTIMVNFDNVELASQGAQQAVVPTVLQSIITAGIPAAQVAAGAEFHLNNNHGYTAQDQAAFVAFVPTLPASTTLFLSEPDMTDIAYPGTGSAQRTARQTLTNQAWQAVYSTSCLGASGVWARIAGTGSWQKNPIDSWLNIDPPSGSARSDGDVEYSDLVDVTWNRLGGVNSAQDAYGTVMGFLAAQAA